MKRKILLIILVLIIILVIAGIIYFTRNQQANKNPEDINVRSELMWDSSIAECGLLKLGKITDFQAHQIEHQLGAYTNSNHGQGLAIIHPKLYTHIYKENISKFARFAKEVWNVDSEGLSDEEVAKKGIEELDKFIKEMMKFMKY